MSGELSRDFRVATSLSGFVGDLIEGTHIDSTDPHALSEIGFWSETLVAFAQMQGPNEKVRESNHPFETKTLCTDTPVDGLGTLKFTITYRNNEYTQEEVARAYMRLKTTHGVDIWTAQKWARFQLSFIDFIAGASAGSFYTSVLKNEAENDSVQSDNHFRLKTYLRQKADHHAQLSLRLKKPIDTIPQALVNAWQTEDIKERILAATTLRSADLGVYERFLRTITYLEKWLHKRYPDCGEPQATYKAGVEDYLAHLKTAQKDIQDFAKRFAGPRYPKGNSLKELLIRALEDCAPLGLACDIDQATLMVDRRNELAHGEEPTDANIMRSLLIGSDIGLAIIELLTLKDIGLLPENQYRPRYERLGSQCGIYSQRG